MSTLQATLACALGKWSITEQLHRSSTEVATSTSLGVFADSSLRYPPRWCRAVSCGLFSQPLPDSSCTSGGCKINVIVNESLKARRFVNHPSSPLSSINSDKEYLDGTHRLSPEPA
ncbi:hypothetical protein KSP39_PZI010707 [Platanthera zijinensis]|uniref:Uncharacterized protein n=1 Tax=Platanthera zijinensis TaxID=2320716 RepID=A0AAP0BK57_9ASPA